MPPNKTPQYGSPLLAILRGGKQTQAPKPVQFGVPDNRFTPPTGLPQTAQSTTPSQVKPAPVQQAPQMTPMPAPAINPLDIIRRGKEQAIRSPLFGEGNIESPRTGLAEGFLGNTQDRAVLRDMQRRGVNPGIVANMRTEGMFPFLGRTPEEKKQILADKLIDKGIEPNRAIEIAWNSVDKRVSFIDLAQDIETGDSKQAKERLKELNITPQEWVTIQTQRAGEVAGSALESLDFVTAGTTKPLRRVVTMKAGKELDELFKKVASDMTEEDATLLRNTYLNKTPDVDPIQSTQLTEALGIEALPWEEQKATVSNLLKEYDARWSGVDEALNPPAVPNRAGAMDVKPAPDKAPQPKDFKTAEEYVEAQGTPVYHGTNQDFEVFGKGQGDLSATKMGSAKGNIFFTDNLDEAGAYGRNADKSLVANENAFNKKYDDMMASYDKAEMKARRSGKKEDWDIAVKLQEDAETFYYKGIRSTESNARVISAYLDVKNPLVHNANGQITSGKVQEIVEQAKKEGKDGVILKNVSDNPEGTKNFRSNHTIVFSPDQIKTRTQLIDEWKKAQPTTPTVPNRDYPGLRKQGGFADFFAPVKAKETAPTVKPKTEQRIKIDADVKDIRKSLQSKDLTASKIGELETKLAIIEETIPDVSLIRRIAGKQIANDTLSQVQATAQKIVAQSDFLKSISKTDAERILKSPKSFTAREVEGARVIRRANLDDRVTELGYADLDEAGLAIRQFDEVKSDIAAVKADLKEAKGDRALSNKVTKLVTTATAKRRDEVKFLKDQFGLVDSDVRKATGGRDFRTMSEGRFNDTVREMEQIGIERADTMQAKAELMDLMEQRNFEKVENYRKTQDFPPLSEMNADQFRQYAEALSKFQTDDVFLTQRQLEVVDRSSLQGVKTIREARERLLEHIQKMPGLENTKLSDLNVTPAALDYVRYDTALAEKNPFYKYLVTRTHEHMLVGEAEFLTVQATALDLANKAKASRPRGVFGKVKQFIVPKHENIIQYLQAPIDQKSTFAKALTKEELDYANFVSDYYSKAYDHLVMQKELYGSRYVDTYFNHMRRDFLEAWTDDGFVRAIKEWWQSQKDSLMVANIIDQETGEIMAKSKFFANTMYRSGEMVPSQNLTRSFLQYSKTFERKKMFDRMIPEMDIYVQSLTPTGLTKSGLETDRTLKKFVYQYINNKKGRTVPVTQLITQNNPIDIGLRMGNTLVSIIDLGFSVLAQTAATVGEAVTTYQGLGKVGLARAVKRRLWDTGLKRVTDPNAAKILRDNEQFIGRNIWTDILDVDTPLLDRGMKTIFGGFAQSTTEANKIFLLGNLTQAELKSGVISPQRLAQLRLDAGRWRDLGSDMKSIVGSTSFGAMMTKYKGWAIPIARTNIKNIDTLVKTLRKGDMKKALTSRELQETYRIIELSTVLVLLGAYVTSEDADDTFAGKLRERVYMESMTLLGGIDPTLFVSAPRLLSFADQLAGNLKKIALMEQYDSDTRWGSEGDFKGVEGLKRQFTPSAIRSLQSTTPSTGDKDLDAVRKEESQSRKDATDKVESVFKEVENMTPEQRRERLLQEEPDVINKVVDKLLDAQKKAENPEQFKTDSQIKKLTNESKAKYVLAKIDQMSLEERRAYIGGLLERGVISANVVNRIAELASEGGIIEQ